MDAFKWVIWIMIVVCGGLFYYIFSEGNTPSKLDAKTGEILDLQQKIYDRVGEQPAFIDCNLDAIPACPSLTCANTSCPQCPDCTCAPESCTTEYISYTSHFQQVISSICNERDYELNKWDCSDESKEGVDRLRNAGYKGWRMECGPYHLNATEDIQHCWGTNGQMLVEFTSCEIVHPRNYWRYKDD